MSQPDTPETTQADYLVIGSGVAGLTFALQTSEHAHTIVLTKKNRAESNSNYAQGGIACVVAEDDNVHLHANDTLVAGAGLCHPDSVDVLVNEGPLRVRHLIELGANFNMHPDGSGGQVLELGREGGHSRNRIVHAVDRTGWECERVLLAATRQRPLLEVIEHCTVIDLAVVGTGANRQCIGAYALDERTGKMRLFRARAVLLATGGCGAIFLHTTNPDIATGDGVAMAWRAGAPIANMEFIQFHPTALCHPSGESFLISEAVRGEGGILRTSDGATFMHKYHQLKDLAPRDIVARAIHAERTRLGDSCVYLDVTHLDHDYIRKRFPTIYDHCLELGIDITKEPIPVVPAAHYSCGGVFTDLNGCTPITGLYAAGEVSCTGVHGANRLASNSLLEAMVYGHRAARHTIDHPVPEPTSTAAPIPVFGADPVPTDTVASLLRKLRTDMENLVGIVRTDAQLAHAEESVTKVFLEANELCNSCAPTPELLELRNVTTVALLIVRSARFRKESRGLHYSTDHPDRNDTEWCRDSVLVATTEAPGWCALAGPPVDNVTPEAVTAILQTAARSAPR